MQTDDVVAKIKDKFVWKWKYTLVLVLNAGYIVLFYYIMKAYA